MTRRSVALLAFVLWAAPAVRADETEKALEADLRALQGTWERAITSGAMRGLPGAVRAEKWIDGKTETVTFYDKEGNILRRHRVDFALSHHDKVKVYTWSNMEILEGPGKGRKGTSKASYIYTLREGTFYEAGGLLLDPASESSSPYMVRWKKR